MERLHHILSHAMIHNLEEAKLHTILDDLSDNLVAEESTKEGTMVEVNERDCDVIGVKIIEEGCVLP
jgi:hypothetical protein